jgi:hypothetical protein
MGHVVRLLAALHLHRHRVDPDLSALVSFPSCRCGSLIWPAPGAAQPRPSSAAATPPLRRAPEPGPRAPGAGH